MRTLPRIPLTASLGLLCLLLLPALSACVLPASSPPPTPDDDELFREAIQTLDVVYGPTFAAMTQVAVVPPASQPQPPVATPIPPSPTAPPAPTATPVPTQPPQQVSQAPTATPRAAPTRKPAVEALPAEDGGFNVQSLNIGVCGGVPAAIFGLRSLSSQAFDSLSLTIEDLTEDENLYGPETSNAPFLGSDRDCPPGSDRLRSGRLGYVGGEVGRGLSGRTIWAEIILCTREDLEGACYRAIVEFIMP
jgi:hypothetical protein